MTFIGSNGLEGLSLYLFSCSVFRLIASTILLFNFTVMGDVNHLDDMVTNVLIPLLVDRRNDADVSGMASLKLIQVIATASLVAFESLDSLLKVIFVVGWFHMAQDDYHIPTKNYHQIFI